MIIRTCKNYIMWLALFFCFKLHPFPKALHILLLDLGTDQPVPGQGLHWIACRSCGLKAELSPLVLVTVNKSILTRRNLSLASPTWTL